MRRILQVRSHVWNAPSETHQDVMRKELSLLWNISDARQKTQSRRRASMREQHNAKDPWRTQSVSISQQPNVTALPSRQCSTQKHTQEREEEGKCCWLLFIHIYYIFLCVCVCALRVWEIWNMGLRMATLIESENFLNAVPYRNFLKLFQL